MYPEAFVCTGAGDAWRALAQQRLNELSGALAEAKSTAEYESLSPVTVCRVLRPSGRLAFAKRNLERETGFAAAAETLDVCCLLCELASRPQSDIGAEAALVRNCAEASILRVALGAAALLRDFGREDFGAAASERKAAAARRKLLRETARSALQSSSVAAQELLLLKHFQTHEVMLGTNSFANARSEIASYLFLVHVLATELLHSESSFLRKAVNLEREKEDSEKLPIGDEEDGLLSLATSTWNMWNMRDSINEFREPLLHRSKSSDLGFANTTCEDQLKNFSKVIQAALQLRWRCSLKVSLSYGLALIMDYSFHLDTVLVCTVSYLCSYGSQYSGGSLRRAMSRGVGVSAGATVGSVLRTLCVLSSVEGSGLSMIFTLIIIFTWIFLTAVIAFRNGPYAYAGFCAGFTAIKFLSSTGPGGIQLSATITASMWACLLAVLVETCVLPVDARELLQGRLGAALLGVWAVLPALVTPDESSLVLRVQEDVFFKNKKVQSCSWPDLTERLKEAGAYEKYVEWRDGYLRWRQGSSSGAKGEISSTKSVQHKAIQEDSTSNSFQHSNSFQPRDPAPHLASKNLEENSPKEGVQLTVAPMPDSMPEMTTVMKSTVETASIQVLLKESVAPFKQEGKRVSLAAVQDVLDEIREALAPVEELALQAAERLDGLKLDGNAWVSLAHRLRVMRLWLSVLARIAKRLGHGCSLRDLIGGEEAGIAAEELLLTVGATLAATARCVAGSEPLPRECTKLEMRLRSSQQGLLAALSRRVSQGKGELAAEVLSLSAGHALMALLGDAGKCLALSVRMTKPQEDQQHFLSPQSPVQPSPAALPDLTERLKAQGQYEKYVKWREGYMQWRSGGLSGSKGEIVEKTTT